MSRAVPSGARRRAGQTFQGDPVAVTTTFKTLPSGLNHVAYAEVPVPARQLSGQVENVDYNRNICAASFGKR